jgi:hypothetical protein
MIDEAVRKKPKTSDVDPKASVLGLTAGFNLLSLGISALTAQLPY